MAHTLQGNLASNQVSKRFKLLHIELRFRENILLTGSMERPRRMEVWSTDGNHITLAATLMGEEFASVASLVDVHPSGAVVGANSSGRLHLFA